MHEVIAKAILASCTKLKYAVSESDITQSIAKAKEGFGDVTSTIAFQVAKSQKKNPAEIANAIKDKLKLPKEVEKCDVAGPYINFIYSQKVYAGFLKEIYSKKENFGKGGKEQIQAQVRDEQVQQQEGQPPQPEKAEKAEKVLIEYPSVNPNKPWHIGHLRNALIGNSLSKILEFKGFTVQKMNYINDLGLQVAQSIWGYMSLPEPQPPEKKFDHLLGKQYVEVSKRAEKIEQEVRRMLKKMEDRDPTISVRAREICESCVQAQLQTAFDYGIYEDVLIWESDIIESKLFNTGIEKLKVSDIFEKKTEGEQKGCIVVKLDEKEFPSMKSDAKVIIRSDGTSTYTAKDVVFAMWKFGLLEKKFKCKTFAKQPNGVALLSTVAKGKETEFSKADRVINVIGVEQAYLQHLIKYVLGKMGYPQAEKYVHVAYGRVALPEGSFSGRLGTWVGYTADELLEEGVKRASAEVEKRLEKSGIKGREKDKVAKQIAVGAIKFSFLRVSHNRQVIFDWNRALSFEGDSGPYLQYACVRANKISVKAKEAGITAVIAAGYSFNAAEKQLIKKLQQFPETVEKSAYDLQTYYLAEYALDVADAFNKFYEASPVINAEKEEEKKTRLAIVVASLAVLRSAIGLLGIDVPEKM